MLTQVKIVLTLPNLVYKGNETNSVLTNPFIIKEKKIFFICLLNKKDLLTLFVSLPL